jgi:hypothetical protein
MRRNSELEMALHFMQILQKIFKIIKYFKDQPVNAVQGRDYCLLWVSYVVHKHTPCANCRPF